MTLEQGAGYLRVTGANGDVCLDTREQIFHVLTIVEGRTTLGPLRFVSAGGGGNTRNQTITLGSVDSNATDLIGFCKLTYGSDYSLLPSGAWYMVGGTLIPFMKRFESLSGTNAKYISSMQMITFAISGGNAVLHEEAEACDDYYAGPSSRLAALTIDYKLFAGTFT